MNDKDMLYKCLECGSTEIIEAKDHRKDGRVCKQCKGKLDPYAFIGIDLATSRDRTVMIPPGEKNEKTPGIGRTGIR